MDMTTWVVGSLGAVETSSARAIVPGVGAFTDVVVVPTAAAFSGAALASAAASRVFESLGASVETLMVGDRSASASASAAERIRLADVVVLCDGSALHAKSVWQSSLVGEAIRDAERLIAVGSCATVLGEIMIDPRGGAPMVGLGYRRGLVVTTPSSEDQLARTRALLGANATLAVVGGDGVLGYDGTSWHQLSGEVAVTRGEVAVTL